MAASIVPACNEAARYSSTSDEPAPANAPILGTAASFAILAGTTVTNTGPSAVTGDLGLHPGTSVTGFPPGILIGAFQIANAVALQAKADAVTAYDALAAEACTTTYLVPTDLGGLTLTAGTYCFDSSANLTGTLTLDAEGDPDAVFVFKTVSTLITASNASVLLINGALPCDVFWKVGSSATVGTGSTFVGTIIALTSIALQTNATLSGRALARNGEVTLDSNVVTRPTCDDVTPTPTPTSTETPTPTGTETPIPSPTPTPECGPPTVEKTFTPDVIVEGGTSTLVITLSNSCDTPAVIDDTLNDYFPAGMAIAGEAGNTCGGVTSTGSTASRISLTGGAIPANGSCTVTVDVTATTAGELCNKIDAAALKTDHGSNVEGAQATLTVIAGTPL